MLDAFHAFLVVFYCGPGFVLGATLGALVPKWRFVIALIAIAAPAAWFGVNHLAREDPDPYLTNVLILYVVGGSFVGLSVGLISGLLGRKAVGRSRLFQPPA